jgi:hypothetical protein
MEKRIRLCRSELIELHKFVFVRSDLLDERIEFGLVLGMKEGDTIQVGTD